MAIDDQDFEGGSGRDRSEPADHAAGGRGDGSEGEGRMSSKPALRAPGGYPAHSGGPVARQGANGTAVGYSAAQPVRLVTSNAKSDDDDDDSGLGNILQIVWQRKWTLLICLVLGIAGGVVYLVRATPEYRSMATIYMDQAQPRVLGDNSYSAMASEQSTATQVQLLMSTAMLKRALDLPMMKQADTIMAQTNPVAYLRSQVKITVDQGSDDILHVSMQSPSPQDNAIVANALTQAFAEYHNDRRRSTAAEVLKVLQNESRRLNDVIDQLETDRVVFQRKHGAAALSTGTGGALNTDKLNRLSATLTEAELRHLNARLALNTAREIGDNEERLRLVASSDPVFAQINLNLDTTTEDPQTELLGRLRERRTYLTEVKRLGPENRQVRELDGEITLLEESIRRAGGTLEDLDDEQEPQRSFAELYRQLLEERVKSAAAAESEYRTLYLAERSQAVTLNSVFAEYESIERQADRAERQLEIVDERMRELNLNDNYDIIDVSVLEPAVATSVPVSPERAKIMGMALVFSLMLGGGLVYLQEMLDDRLRSGEEISSLLKLPILGVVPSMEETGITQCGRIVDTQPKSLVAEAFRTIRTAIHFNPRGASAQVIMVTSPSPGDGKSTVASNLAIATASSGKRTLLIDADCRKPRQHRIFETNRDRGLSSLLLDKPTDGKGIDSPIEHTAIANLDLMACGPVPDRPAEMFNSPRYAKLMRQLRQYYDHIIIDTPPTVPVSDSRIIASQVDGYVMVLRAGQSGRKVAKHAAELLASVGAPAVGLVVNGVTKTWGSYSYYSRYGYYQYGYSAYRDKKNEADSPQLGEGESSPAESQDSRDVEALVK